MLFFNTTTATCQNVTDTFRPIAEAALVESTFTRYSQKEVREHGKETLGKEQNKLDAAHKRRSDKT